MELDFGLLEIEDGLLVIENIEFTGENEEILFKIEQLEVAEGYRMISELIYVRVQVELGAGSLQVGRVSTGLLEDGRFSERDFAGIRKVSNDKIVQIGITNTSLDFGLTLRQFITSVNGQELEENLLRTPVINLAERRLGTGDARIGIATENPVVVRQRRYSSV